MNLSPEEKEVGKDNYYDALGYTRRDFLKGSLAAGAGTAAAAGAMYFGYEPTLADPVRVGVIGTGDEGNILIGALNPDYVQVVAIADIRPSSIHRAFHGDWGGGNPSYTHSLRPGLMQIYGWKTEDEARKNVQVYQDYQELIADPDVEAVIIALPLHLHAAASVAAMRAGKHVLTEKLMAHNVAQCKADGARGSRKEPVPGDRPSAALQRAVRQRRAPAAMGPAGRNPPHSRSVASRQPARPRQLAAAAAGWRVGSDGRSSPQAEVQEGRAVRPDQLAAARSEEQTQATKTNPTE